MAEPTLSIVVPIYNAESFLEDCIGSVRSQMPDECELILVDDGSTDNSVELIRTKFAKDLEQSRFVLLQIANSGPGEARNTGVRAARGRYIGFLDSDDLLLPGYFDAVLDAIRDTQPRIIQFHLTRFQTCGPAKREVIRCHQSPQGQYVLEDVRDDIFAAGKWFPSTRVFSKDLLLSHPFPSERVFYEDLTTLPFIFLEPGSIALLDMPLIAYHDTSTSTTHNHRPEHAATLFEFFMRLSHLPETAATDMLRVQLARTIVFFTMELQLNDIPLGDMLAQIRNIGGKYYLVRHLGRADAAFLRFPKAYALAERVRQGFRRAIG
jgi:glycosyltransferase involved in cell wall biosynthesis